MSCLKTEKRLSPGTKVYISYSESDSECWGSGAGRAVDVQIDSTDTDECILSEIALDNCLT